MLSLANDLMLIKVHAIVQNPHMIQTERDTKGSAVYVFRAKIKARPNGRAF
jgi:hypothetical protein